jgi:hypothetical protein
MNVNCNLFLKILITIKIRAMKTFYPFKISLLLILATIGVISCSKDSDSLLPVNIPPVNNPVADVPLGNIVDYGVVNGDIRMMKIAIVPKTFNLYDSLENVSVASAQVDLSLYVNKDGIIPTGEYVFSNLPDKAPFTFDSGNFIVSNSSSPDQIADGSIIVTQDGINYVLTIQAKLKSGLTFSEIYHGSVAYSDSK